MLLMTLPVKPFSPSIIIIGYPRFSCHFGEKDKTYFKGVPFSRVQSIYFFDSDLRNLITKMIESIEIYCRTKFARQFTDMYGVHLVI